jgi:hypothetical protein
MVEVISMISAASARPRTPLRGQEALRDHRVQRVAEAVAHRLLLLGRKGGDQARHRVGGVLGMHGGDHQVARLGRLERDVDRLRVAHLADLDDVGVLPQRRAQAALEALRVRAHLALADGAQVVVVQELDGVLQRDDVPMLVVVEVLDHGGHRGALPRARDAGHQDQPALGEGDLRDDLGRPSFSSVGIS